ncbi:unnamed protein product, partial [Amoebophrya sp. A25]
SGVKACDPSVESLIRPTSSLRRLLHVVQVNSEVEYLDVYELVAQREKKKAARRGEANRSTTSQSSRENSHARHKARNRLRGRGTPGRTLAEAKQLLSSSEETSASSSEQSGSLLEMPRKLPDRLEKNQATP